MSISDSNKHSHAYTCPPPVVSRRPWWLPSLFRRDASTSFVGNLSRLKWFSTKLEVGQIPVTGTSVVFSFFLFFLCQVFQPPEQTCVHWLHGVTGGLSYFVISVGLRYASRTHGILGAQKTRSSLSSDLLSLSSIVGLSFLAELQMPSSWTGSSFVASATPVKTAVGAIVAAGQRPVNTQRTWSTASST